MDNQAGAVEIAADKVWKFFSSVKLAVVLLIIIAIVSVAGTVIRQNQPTEEYLREYSQATVNLFEALGFFDLYHTWWFVLLLFLLTANLTVCTLERFPAAWKMIKAPLKPIGDDVLKAVPLKKEIVLKGTVENAEAATAHLLKAKGFSFLVSKEQGVTHFASQKGAYSRLGVYVTHVSIILIFTGALIGAFFGFKGFLNLPEGEASAVVYLRNEPMWDRIMDALGVSKSQVIYDPRGGVPALPMGFYVRCDDFDVEYYVNQGRPSGMPSEYHSTLSVFSADREKIFEKRIRVNDPLKYRGITFYQSSYGTMPGAEGKIVLSVRPKDGRSMAQTVVVDPGGTVYVSSIDRTIKALGVAPYGMRDPMSGRVMFYESRNNEFINPTIGIEVYKGKGGGKPLYSTEVMKIDSATPSMPENYTIKYVDYWGARYTGLQVTRDPGVWVVYTGFLLLCIGPLIAFFGSHRKIWVRVQDRKGQAVLLVAGSANRNRLGFERDFNTFVEDIAR